MPTLSCVYCGNQYYKIPALALNSRYCSRNCRDSAKKRPKIELICEVCNNTYRVSSSKKNSRYCSNSCHKKAQRKGLNTNLVCEFCGKIYSCSPSSLKVSRYCCIKCYHTARKKGLKVKLKCKTCGKEYELNPSRAKGSRYCSKKCYRTYQTRPITLVCQYCKGIYTVSSYQATIRKYCSRKCSSKDKPNQKILCKCIVCGNEFKRRPSAFKKGNGGKFCSKKCYMKGAFLTKSSLEKTLQGIFPDNIKYTGNGEFWITFNSGRKKCPDFIAIDKKGNYTKNVIEAHGNYWHLNEDEQELIDAYAKVGYKCLVLWESEVKNNLPNVLTKIANFIGQPTWQLKLF